ncbi:triphosphoribosyl-dephospho-CoA synthase [Pseudoduganella lurida]|uniref:Probable 2-(5''-triphosphoribosyl)-3'-dephosphocoenzyme-A synthase n=1 Tax=Pseudoduganella lurida TaxID=1036180 RepID=A0A562RJZ7_9BURK|nr:triphosphoribosyl-dephospho-CoA synthase [Pseudoduganella lurida]TWI69369.1 triphosphoribosyl-dephospho-CoA synthase [Pseudoduganella lurida]
MNPFNELHPRIVAGSRANVLAGLAVNALVDEAMLTPKPGLVDLRGSGAHRDLSWLLMCQSAHALRPAFAAMAGAGATMDDLPALRRRIGAIGRMAEATMMTATGGVNTHRGAIWALGLLVTAAAQGAGSAAIIAARAGALARLADPEAPASTGNKGEAARRTYCVGGARGQAEAGFPHVVDVALPMLLACRARGDGESAARLNSLLAIVAELDDTCLLARGGTAALAAAQAGAQAVLDAGGVSGATGPAAFQALEADMLARGTSPGGAADLLAAALLLDSLGNQPIDAMEAPHGATAV